MIHHASIRVGYAMMTRIQCRARPPAGSESSARPGRIMMMPLPLIRRSGGEEGWRSGERHVGMRPGASAAPTPRAVRARVAGVASAGPAADPARGRRAGRGGSGRGGWQAGVCAGLRARGSTRGQQPRTPPAPRTRPHPPPRPHLPTPLRPSRATRPRPRAHACGVWRASGSTRRRRARMSQRTRTRAWACAHARKASSNAIMRALAYVRACVRACVHACVRACMRVCVCERVRA